MSKKKYVLFICGGKWQLPWLTFLKNKGHAIILVDPYDFSPCVKYADVFFKCDAKDISSIYQFVTQNNYQIDFVTSDQTDVSTITVAELSNKFGLFGNSIETVKRFTNKLENRKFAKELLRGHVPQFQKAESPQGIIEFYENIKNAIIIKPPEAQSSRGVFKIDHSNINSVGELFADSMQYSTQNYLIAEEFVSGIEITVEGLCIDHQHHVLAASSKRHFRTGIASELLYPAKINAPLLKEVYEFHNAFINLSGLKFGITHAEYIVDEKTNSFWMVECACRGGGSLIPSHIVPWVSGVDVYDSFYQTLTGNKPIINVRQNPRHAVLHFFEFSSGEVLSVSGLAEASEIEGVIRVELEFEKGTILKAAGDDRSRQGFVIVTAENADELQARLQKAINTIKVTVAE